jgi:fluoroacetyl-CoA thioesterase
MKNIFKAGDIKTYSKIVQADETAKFENGEVHPVYSTFALARDAEWCCRLFVLEMKESDEEGIGTMVSVYHHAPAQIGETVTITATVKSINKNEIICTYEAHSGTRLVADGEQAQKILKKEKLKEIFNR